MSHAILFVDDEKGICTALKRTIRRSPYTFLEANSGEQALSLLKTENVDVVVSDQRMPGMNGTELLTIIKNQYPSVGRIMLSGYSDFDALTNAVNEANIFSYLPKPWNDQTLLQTIDSAINDPRRGIPEEQQDALSHQPLPNDKTTTINDIETSLLKKQILLESDIINDELLLKESTLVDIRHPGNILHYFRLQWPRFERYSHQQIIDLADQAGYLDQLYGWYTVKTTDLCIAQQALSTNTNKKIVFDLFCEQMMSDKFLQSMALLIMHQQYHMVFKISFDLLHKSTLEDFLKETYISKSSIMLNLGQRIIDVSELEHSLVEYLEIDAKHSTIHNDKITERRINMLQAAQNQSIKTILTEVNDSEQFLYAKKINVDFFSRELNKNLTFSR